METIKQWYIQQYPTDELGQLLNRSMTFKQLYKGLPEVYELLGVDDSLVRERVLDKLAKVMNVSYDSIYNKWLN